MYLWWSPGVHAARGAWAWGSRRAAVDPAADPHSALESLALAGSPGRSRGRVHAPGGHSPSCHLCSIVFALASPGKGRGCPSSSPHTPSLVPDPGPYPASSALTRTFVPPNSNLSPDLGLSLCPLPISLVGWIPATSLSNLPPTSWPSGHHFGLLAF